MGLTLVTPPADEPVTLPDAKLHLRVDGTAEDALITALIQAAREHVEGLTGRVLVTQTWEHTLDAFPCDGVILLPRPPLVEIESVKYVAPDGTLTTLDPSQYVADAGSLPGCVRRAYSVAWPATRCEANAVRVRYSAGYGAAAVVPASLRAALLLVLGELYENREASIVGTIRTDNPTVQALLGPYRYVEIV